MTTERAPAAASAWWTTPRPLAAPRVRLICLPHAGAGASTYFAWGAALQPAGIEVRAVQYPGRENRLTEPRFAAASPMTRALADVWPALCGGGACALFGHSMGALIAFELALELARRGTAHFPERIFISGRNPPTVPPKMPPIHQLPDPEFLREVAARCGNLPAQVTDDPAMLALVTPILRADFTLVDTYRWQPAPPLATPLSVFGGLSDPWTTPAELEQWRERTRGECRIRHFAGDHFFHQKARPEVLAAVTTDLSPWPAGDGQRDTRLPTARPAVESSR